MAAHSSADPTAPGILIDRARLYDLLTTLVFAGRKRATFNALVAASGARSGDTVLDVGCGTGYFARLLAAAVGPNGQIVGVDASPAMVARARGRSARLVNVGFRVGLAQSLALPDASFDVVTSSLVMHHLPPEDRPGVLKEMHRVLRPGGRLLIADVQPSNRLARHLFHGLGHAPSQTTAARRRSHDPGAMAHSSLDELTPLLPDAGFRPHRAGDVRSWLRYVTATKPASG